MQVDVIDDMDGFLRLREQWDAIYAADPEAQFFLSWTWLSVWLRQLENGWIVLAARSGAGAGGYAGFFPLRLRTEFKAANGALHNEINMAGNYAADYTGFICAPGTDDAVVNAFARHLKRMRWTRLNFENLLMSPRRMSILMRHFAAKNFVVREEARVNARDGIDNCVCPIARLPADWDAYLAGLSANTRQKARRVLRQLDNGGDLRVTLSGPQTYERDIGVLLDFWATKWAPRKGSRMPGILGMNRRMLTRCAEVDALFLPVLWHGEKPVGVLASFVDREKKSLLFYMGGRDETFNTPPPGFLLHAYSLRHAVTNGIASYDFLRGNEPYKYSFGVEERRIACIAVATRTGRNNGDKLDLRSIPLALERANALHESGRFADAERIYRQVVDADPAHANALYCYAQLLAKTQRWGAAKRAYKTLLALRPHSDKAWLGLARALEARGELEPARAAFSEVVKQSPRYAPAHYGLGNIAMKRGAHEEALAHLRTALQLDPGSSKGQAIWTAALAAIAAVSAEKKLHCATMARTLAHDMRARGVADFAALCEGQARDLFPPAAESGQTCARLSPTHRAGSPLPVLMD